MNTNPVLHATSSRFAIGVLGFGLIAMGAAPLGMSAPPNPQTASSTAVKEGNQAKSGETGKDEKVVDSVRTITTSLGTVDVHDSVSDVDPPIRFYVAPRFRFLLLPPEREVIARADPGIDNKPVPVQMSLEMVNPAARDELVAALIKDGATIKDGVAIKPDVRNLRVDSLRVGVASELDRERYGVTSDFVLPNPQPSRETISVDMPVVKAREFAEAFNKGRINMIVTYSYNRVTVDSRYEMLRASMLLDNQQMRQLTANGDVIWSANQNADAFTNIKREIESKVVEGIGKIEPNSFPVERLMEVFSVGETWKQTEEKLQQLDDRIRGQFNLGISESNIKDFQPFRYHKKVVEMMDKENSVAAKKKAYYDLFKSEATQMRVSAGFAIGPFGASGGFSKQTEDKLNKGEMTDDEFREHIRTYHAAEYTKQEVQERGIKLFDSQKVKALGETKIISTTIKPTLGTGLRGITLTPTLEEAKENQQQLLALQKRLEDSERKLNALESNLESRVIGILASKLVCKTIEQRIGPPNHDGSATPKFLTVADASKVLGAWMPVGVHMDKGGLPTQLGVNYMEVDPSHQITGNQVKFICGTPEKANAYVPITVLYLNK